MMEKEPDNSQQIVDVLLRMAELHKTVSSLVTRVERNEVKNCGGVLSKDLAQDPAKKPLMANEPDKYACNRHPKAPHGFDRNASHANDRYVCECESWDAYQSGYDAGLAANLELVQDSESEELEADGRRYRWLLDNLDFYLRPNQPFSFYDFKSVTPPDKELGSIRLSRVSKFIDLQINKEKPNE